MLIENNFLRFPDVPQLIQTKLDFGYSYSCTPEGSGQGELTLHTSGKNSENNDIVYQADIKYIGIFQMDQANPNMDIDEFMKSHAPAHMFPYLREFLSSLSVRAGLPTIILPPINILALTDASKISSFDGDEQPNKL